MPSVLKNNVIRIKLATSGQQGAVPTIKPGTVLYGEVEYKPPAPERISALTVCLIGKLVVKAKGGRREVTQVFGVQHSILKRDDEPILLEARTHRFPFHFVVPWITEYDRTGTFKEDALGLFTETPHRVPPSLGPKSRGDAQICYSCYAIGRRTGHRLNDFSVVVDFPSGEELENIRCIVEVPEIGHKPPVILQKELLPPTQKSPSGFFRRSSTVSLDAMSSFGSCILVLESPSVAVLGERIMLNAAIKHSAASLAWKISITGTSLVSKTWRRLKDTAEPFGEEHSNPILSAQPPVLLLTDAPQDLEMIVADDDTVPSFKSYTISRLHALRLTIASSIHDETVRSHFEEIVNVDLPVELFRRGMAFARVNTSDGIQDINGQAALPPAYEDSPVYQT